MRLKKYRILVTSITIIDLIFVELIRLYIHTELVESITNPTASSRSDNRHETSDNLGFNDAIDDRREYRIILFILRYASLFPFSSPL